MTAAGMCSSSETEPSNVRAGPNPGIEESDGRDQDIARACGDEISDMQPMLDARLEDGSRVAACSHRVPWPALR